MSLPYALRVSTFWDPGGSSAHSGQNSRVVSPWALVVDGQVPSAYSALKTALAVDRLAKDVPTTVIRPVPMYRFVLGILNLDICTIDSIPEEMSEAEMR